MKFSIVTISFNQGNFLEKTILSVLNQKNVELEYIIVDAGSSDGSRDIIERYRDKFSKIILEKDEGPADGLNKGFKYATGEIFGYLNADDTYEKNALKNVATAFNSNNKIDVLCGNGFKINQYEKKIKRIYTDKFSLSKYALGIFNFIQPSVFIKKNVFINTGGFNINNKTCWDAELLIDIGLNKYNIVCVPYFLSNFRVHDKSISGTGRSNNQYFRDRDRIKSKILCNTKIYNIPFQREFYRLLNLIQTPQKLFSKISLPK